MGGDEDGGYRAPRLAINRVYTRKGDRGSTALVGGQKVSKDHDRIHAYGTVDELGAFVGAARQSVLEALRSAPDEALAELGRSLLRTQHELFNLGSILATLPEDVGSAQPRVTRAEVARLEEEIDRYNDHLPALRSFVLAGGCRLNADLHLARTVCRRAERLLVTLARAGAALDDELVYLNRLGDALFVWSRWASSQLGAPEVLWDPNAPGG
jgi:cob(I)alamin adenosyltransferase